MKKLRELSIGFVFCLVVTFVAHNLAKFPLLHILGTMVTAILLGIILRSLSEKTIVKGQAGINYAAKYILRAGIILMGVRLNMSDIIAAGWQTIFLDISVKSS